MNSYIVYENIRLDDDEIKLYMFVICEGRNVFRRVYIKICLFLRLWKIFGNLMFLYMFVFF